MFPEDIDAGQCHCDFVGKPLDKLLCLNIVARFVDMDLKYIYNLFMNIVCIRICTCPYQLSALNTTVHFLEFVIQGGGKQLRRAARGWRTLLGLFSSPLSVALPSNGNHLFLAVMGFIFAQPSSSQDGRCVSLNLALAAARTERRSRPVSTAGTTAVIVERIVVVCVC